MAWGWFSGSNSPSTPAATTTTTTTTTPPPPAAPSTPPAATAATAAPTAPAPRPSLLSRLAPPNAETAASPPLPEPVRLRRQLTLLFAGPLFLTCSILITRRSLRRKYLSTIPPRFTSNQHPPLLPPNGAMDALEALNLATLNVMGFAVTLVGGGMFALDVCNVEELRRKVKGDDGLGGDMMPEAWRELKRKEKEEEEEMEEWMVNILARKEVKERAKKLAEMELAGGGK